ncbi:2,6-beta-D-fructofuranosidase [Bacteroidia bacterium]|nr:2,6-beta-D-fructofuranosidase [Bacteroidia bacterium]
MQDISIQTNENGNTSLQFKTSQRYLLLPIEDTGDELQTELFVDDKLVNSYVIRLAKNKIDYWVPLDLSQWQGKAIKIEIPGLNESAVCLKEIKLSNNFDFDFDEKYRPAYHFTPPYGWMNDPNGMVYYGGEYHLFYQYNPYGTRWQNMSWGHAVSTDLTHWQHLPVALYPDSLGTIFSGSAVVDETNSAGFQTGGEKTLLAFYTQAERGGQWQSLAYSNDKGRTWTKYAGNPVLKKANTPDFRDPKVFWYAPANKWIMVLAVGNHAEIYSSANAKEWTFESEFGANYGSHDGVWECPDLLQFGEKWVLLISNDRVANVRHSATQYFVGSFDGHAFTCDFSPTEQHWLDYGKDHYATVSWANAPADRKIVLPWMSNWQYANDVPTKYFRSAMALPRELTLVQENGKYLVKSYPVEEIQARKGKAGNVPDFNTNRIFDVPTNGIFEILLEIEAQAAQQFGFNLKNSKNESVEFAFDLQKNEFSVDRAKSGIVNFNATFATKSVAPVLAKSAHTLRVFVDKSSVEAFLDGGEAAITNLVFPNEPYKQIEFFTKDNQFKINDLKIFKIE